MRSELLRQGMSLTEATRKVAETYSVENEILPMCEEEVETRVVTIEGDMHFQEFWVRRKGKPEVIDVYFKGIEDAKPTEDVIKALEKAKGVIIGPSNPITSISPILSLRGMRDLLRRKKVVAVSPIIGKTAVSGPAAKLMRAKGFEVSPKGVGEVYRDFLDILVVDSTDGNFEGETYEVVATNIMMRNKEDAVRLSEFLLQLF
jgi:LPPG:FO 2-phospho-L-lactate transferase